MRPHHICAGSFEKLKRDGNPVHFMHFHPYKVRDPARIAEWQLSRGLNRQNALLLQAQAWDITFVHVFDRDVDDVGNAVVLEGPAKALGVQPHIEEWLAKIETDFIAMIFVPKQERAERVTFVIM
jgi:hypothetical protein